MSVDELIEGLSAEAREAMRPLLRQAYDRGFREGLASAGQGVADPAPAPAEQPPPTSAPPPAPDPAPVAWAGSFAPFSSRSRTRPAPVAWAGRVEEDPADPSGDEADDGEDDDAEDAPAPRPILANAKVGTLRRRIIRTFDLERFEIDVVICRSGDPDRRQLKSTARLASYRREEG